MADDKAPAVAPSDGATAAADVAQAKVKAAPSANGKARPKLVNCRVPIRDGFTMSDTYKSSTRYDGVAISYRPAIQQDCIDFFEDPRPYLVKARELVTKHVQGWNVANDAGDDVAPLDVASVSGLVHPVLNWMVNCITGYPPAVEAEDAKN